MRKPWLLTEMKNFPLRYQMNGVIRLMTETRGPNSCTNVANEYISLLEEVRSELEAETEFLKKAAVEPIRFFTETKERFKSHRSMLFLSLNYKARQGQGSVHEFQRFLAEKMNEVFQAWLLQNGTNLPLSIRVRTRSSFPSLFAVYDGDTEILQFNIFEKTYGIRQRPLTEEELLKRGQDEERRLRTLKNKEEKSLAELVKVKEKPYLYSFSSWKGFYLLFLRYERTMKRINELIKETKERVCDFEKQIRLKREALPSQIQANERRRKAVEAAEPFFKSLGYSLETRREKLY